MPENKSFEEKGKDGLKFKIEGGFMEICMILDRTTRLLWRYV